MTSPIIGRSKLAGALTMPVIDATDFAAGWYINGDLAHYRDALDRKRVGYVDLAACRAAPVDTTKRGPRWTIHEHAGVVPLCEACREAVRR